MLQSGMEKGAAETLHRLAELRAKKLSGGLIHDNKQEEGTGPKP